jgi:hypothetical protein
MTQPVCEGQYVPCAGKKCGDSCQACPPNQPGCYETQELKYCDTSGSCVGFPPVCEAPYVPCAGKKCGDSCQVCPPNQPGCYETQELKYCNASGTCSGRQPICAF